MSRQVAGGDIKLSSARSQPFRTQIGSTYDSLEDCHWTVLGSLGKNIKFTINNMDIRNSTNNTERGDKCTGDYLEVSPYLNKSIISILTTPSISIPYSRYLWAQSIHTNQFILLINLTCVNCIRRIKKLTLFVKQSKVKVTIFLFKI